MQRTLNPCFLVVSNLMIRKLKELPLRHPVFQGKQYAVLLY